MSIRFFAYKISFDVDIRFHLRVFVTYIEIKGTTSLLENHSVYDLKVILLLINC